MILLLITTPQTVMCGVVDDVEDAAEIVDYVLDMFCQEYWDGDWSVANEHGTPVKNVKSDEHIRAYIDIIGFKNESIINGTHYVDGSAKDFAIVKRDAWHTPVSGTVVSFTTTYGISDSNNKTTATQTTDFHWKYKVCTIVGCYWAHVYEGPLTVSCTVDSPENFTTRIPDVKVYIRSYNRSVAPVTYIYVPIENDSSMKDVVVSRVRYNVSTVSRYDQVGWVMKNDRSTEHVEFVDGGVQPSWKKNENQIEIDHFGRYVTVFGGDFNTSLLNISLHTPYETRYITNYTIETMEGNAKMNVPLLKVIALFIVSAIAIIFILKVVKCAL